MPRLSETARLTTRDGAVWRPCAICDTFSPLPPGHEVCPACAEVIQPPGPTTDGGPPAPVPDRGRW